MAATARAEPGLNWEPGILSRSSTWDTGSQLPGCTGAGSWRQEHCWKLVYSKVGCRHMTQEKCKLQKFQPLSSKSPLLGSPLQPWPPTCDPFKEAPGTSLWPPSSCCLALIEEPQDFCSYSSLNKFVNWGIEEFKIHVLSRRNWNKYFIFSTHFPPCLMASALGPIK